MNALIWKRLKEVRTRWINFILFLIIPPFYLISLFFITKKIDNIMAYAPVCITLLCTLIHFSVDDLVSSEALLSTSLSVKKIWITNILFTVITTYVYCTILIFLGVVYLYMMGNRVLISMNVIIQYITNLILAFSLVGGATCHYSDYSYIKKLIASFISIINIAVPILFFLYINSIFIDKMIIFISLLIGILLFSTCYFVVYNANKEKIIINIQILVASYNSNNIEE